MVLIVSPSTLIFVSKYTVNHLLLSMMLNTLSLLKLHILMSAQFGRQIYFVVTR